MAEESSWGFIAIAALVIVGYNDLTSEARHSPCVYSHSFTTDLVNGNDQKRTCTELLKESNSRIEALQARINALTEQINDMSVQPTANQAPVSGLSAEEPPTLVAKVNGYTAREDDTADDDDDDDK